VNRLTTAVLVLVLALGAACEPSTDEGTAVLTGLVLAGPTCPVVRDPPDPACEDRPVPDAEIVIVDAENDEVASIRSDADGTFTVSLPAGEYQLVPQPVEGLMGTAPAMFITVADRVDPEPVAIVYDTGIR